jgi:hypothetical protein
MRRNGTTARAFVIILTVKNTLPDVGSVVLAPTVISQTLHQRLFAHAHHFTGGLHLG